MKYDIKLVYSFITFAESKNIVEAAGKLGLSQPGLSAHLKSFESQFLLPLFIVQGRKKILSPFGQEIYQQLKYKLSGVDDVIEQISLKFSDRNAAVVRVGGRREILARALKKNQFPGQIIAIDCESAEGVSMALKSQLDLLISQEKPDSMNLIAKQIFRDQFQILIPKKMKLRFSSVTKQLLHELTSLPFLAYKTHFDQLDLLRKHFGITDNQYTFRVVEDWQTLIELSENGQGWTLAPTSFIYNELKCESLLVPTEIISSSQFFLIYPKNLSKTKWFTELVTSFKEIF